MVKPLGKKTISQKLREENKEIKNRKRYLKYWGQSKVTGFIFDIVEAAEAERLVKKEIRWKEKTRRILVLRKGKTWKQKTTSSSKVPVQKRKEKV